MAHIAAFVAQTMRTPRVPLGRNKAQRKAANNEKEREEEEEEDG